MILDPTDYKGIKYDINTNYIDYIEIGTCDWDTFSMTKPELHGIIIEPISIYINNIPFNKNVKKIQCAISNFNGVGNMYYIPPSTIERDSIVNCFRGMNCLDKFHQGHISNNLTNKVTTEKVEVKTFFKLLEENNINYIDFLKIDTEGNDCTILNNILDEIDNGRHFILPKYILFENNCLTDLQKREETKYRLYTHGYIHIFTKDDNTFMYNCRTYYNLQLHNSSIKLPRNITINKNICHYFQNVHSYIELGQKYLFQNVIDCKVVEDISCANMIWTTQSLEDYNKLKNSNLNAKMINIVHGGGFGTLTTLLEINTPNIIVKSFDDYKYLYNNNTNVMLFIGKYTSLNTLFNSIYEYRVNNYKKIYETNNFLMLNGFFKMNNDSIVSSYHILRKKYTIDLYGYDSENGWGDTTTSDLSSNVLTKYKFYLHLKGKGYLCNSALFAMMAGIPIIMSRQNYYTLYYQFIPIDLLIIYDNDDCNKTDYKQIESVIQQANNMTYSEYDELSNKLFIHGHFFRCQYKEEIENLFAFINGCI